MDLPQGKERGNHRGDSHGPLLAAQKQRRKGKETQEKWEKKRSGISRCAPFRAEKEAESAWKRGDEASHLAGCHFHLLQ